jgi:two-component system CheB/CheR fusion protein
VTEDIGPDDTNTAPTAPADPPERVTIVGIGSSAGGLEAISELTRALPTKSNMAYLIAQHLSPSHRSMLVDLIKRESSIGVADAADGMTPQPNCIYITPPNRDIELRDNRICLSEARSGPMPKPDINRLFHSIAKDCGSHCIGVILSGTGTDGSSGMIEIKAAGGITIAQDPKSAKYDGMPLAAIHSDAADLILDPTGIAKTLNDLSTNVISSADIATKVNLDLYSEIIDIVLRETGVNLVHYKKTSVQRRIRRRMSIANRLTMEDYLAYLKDTPKEVQDLARDAFISVTGFFRDPEAFASLAEHLKNYLDKAESSDEIRVWVPGCATGEEAFTIAILFEEYQRIHQRNLDYRVFATDITADPLGMARIGNYSIDAVATVEPEILERYFRELADGYSVIRRVRDHVIYSTHDLIRDAPFSKLDLVSCRNVLIYFDNELQQQVFDTFHYALKPKGMLMLGMSENNTQAESLFRPLDPKHRLFLRLDAPTHRSRLPLLLTDSTRKIRTRADSTTPPPLEGLEERLFRLLSQRFGPASIIVNQHNEIMFSYGDLSELFSMRPGPGSLDALNLVQDGLRSTLRALLYKGRREAAASADAVEQVIAPLREGVNVRLTVTAFDPNRDGWLMISFQVIARTAANELLPGTTESDSEEDAQLMVALEHELLSTRESLQTVVEELETTNEELQAANEELQSSNEEFQSTNEELQTTNEELQSSNEELLTLNDELQEKNRQYQQLANQLQNIQTSIETPLLVVDHNLRITRFVPKVDEIIPLEAIREHDHIVALPWREEINGLREMLMAVIDSHQAQNHIVRLGPRVWQLNISPFIDESNRASGAILIFNDATDLHESRERIRQERERAQITLESIGDGVIRVDPEGLVEYVNPVGCSMLGLAASDAEGKPFNDVFPRLGTEGEEPEDLIGHILAEDGTDHMEGECDLQGANGRTLRTSYSVGATTDRVGNRNGAVVTFHDMTEHHETISHMSWISTHDALTGAINRREMEARIANVLGAIRQGRKREAVFVYLDLDQFKVVNDTCGHLAGDELLKNVTRMLRQHIRHRDTLGRLGGDEFGLLLEGCVLAEAEMVAEKIRAAVAEYRFHWKDKVFRIGVSIGIVAVTNDSGHVSDVLSNADAACYAAKERGRNRIQIHTPDDEELASQRADLNWVSEITDAMDNERMRLHMQEIRAVDNQHPSHWEVLLRMFNRKGKLLPPGSFLPAAERYGLIQSIDEWVIDKLFATLSEYRPANADGSHPNVSVNLSGSSFTDHHIIDKVKDALERYHVDPSRIAFEITETAAISNLGMAKQFIEQIKALGCGIALDDFGTGMSSLNYLQHLDVDTLKIDGTFISDIETNPLSRTIVKAIVEIARELQIRTVAEFAETDAIVDRLCEIGICSVQGEAIGKAIPIEAFLDQTFVASGGNAAAD